MEPTSTGFGWQRRRCCRTATSSGSAEFRMIFHQPARADAEGQDALLGTVVQIKSEEITVMVVDIRGFTQLSQDIGAEKLGEVMGHFIRESGSLLKAQGAWGQKYIGDAVMGIWMHDAAHPGADFILKALHCIHGISRIAGRTPRSLSPRPAGPDRSRH